MSTDQDGRMKPRVTVLALGGTIASTPATSGGSVPTLTAADLVAAVPGLDAVARVDARTVRSTASAGITSDDLRSIAAIVEAETAAGVSGVVVTQGTDTLEESAYLLDLLHAGDVPVVVTGAMRTPATPGADGPANVLAAVTVAGSPQARGLGVLVVLDDEIHAARHVAKTHSSSTAAFASPGLGPLGRVVEGDVRLSFVPRARSPHVDVPVDAPWPSVPILRVTLGGDPREIDALATYADGLVVEGVGGGHVPESFVAPLEALAARIPVVLASRAGGGGTLARTYGYPGSELDLFRRGLLCAGPLDALKARLLTGAAVAGAAGRPAAELRARVERLLAAA